MTLPDTDVDALVAEGKSLVENEPTVSKLLSGLEATPKARADTMRRHGRIRIQRTAGNHGLRELASLDTSLLR